MTKRVATIARFFGVFLCGWGILLMQNQPLPLSFVGFCLFITGIIELVHGIVRDPRFREDDDE